MNDFLATYTSSPRVESDSSVVSCSVLATAGSSVVSRKLCNLPQGRPQWQVHPDSSAALPWVITGELIRELQRERRRGATREKIFAMARSVRCGHFRYLP